jgi:hypothetical protein
MSTIQGCPSRHSSRGADCRAHMSFRDLLQVRSTHNNGIAARHVVLIAKLAVEIALQPLFKSPAVREHGQERRYRELPHAAVEISR